MRSSPDNSTYDLRLDVPARFYINGQLLSLMKRGGTLWDAKKFLFSQEPYAKYFGTSDIYSYCPYDHSQAIATLYCSIVVPREILNLPKDHSVFGQFDAENVTGLFKVVEPKPIDAYHLIRYLRNSVAHALFSISSSNDSWTYEFWTDREPLFRATISQLDLLTFITNVATRLTNDVLALKHKIKSATTAESASGL